MSLNHRKIFIVLACWEFFFICLVTFWHGTTLMSSEGEQSGLTQFVVDLYYNRTRTKSETPQIRSRARGTAPFGKAYKGRNAVSEIKSSDGSKNEISNWREAQGKNSYVYGQRADSQKTRHVHSVGKVVYKRNRQTYSNNRSSRVLELSRSTSNSLRKAKLQQKRLTGSLQSPNNEVFDETSPAYFRELFAQWQMSGSVGETRIGEDYVADPDKYFIYRCDKRAMFRCGGWADRIDGILAAYLFANLTGRVFKIDIQNPPCDLTRYLVPNKVNWSLPTPFHLDLKRSPECHG